MAMWHLSFTSAGGDVLTRAGQCIVIIVYRDI